MSGHPDWNGAQAAGAPVAIRGWMAVPLKAQDGSNIGFLQACDKVEGEFTDADEAIMTQLASITRRPADTLH